MHVHDQCYKIYKIVKNIQINIQSLVIRYNELRFVIRENCLDARKTYKLYSRNLDF